QGLSGCGLSEGLATCCGRIGHFQEASIEASFDHLRRSDRHIDSRRRYPLRPRWRQARPDIHPAADVRIGWCRLWHASFALRRPRKLRRETAAITLKRAPGLVPRSRLMEHARHTFALGKSAHL